MNVTANVCLHVRDSSADESVNHNMGGFRARIIPILGWLVILLHTAGVKKFFLFFLYRGNRLHLLNGEPLILFLTEINI